MISTDSKHLRGYCYEDIRNIENYDKAIQHDAVAWLRNNGYPKADQGTISKVCSGRGVKKRKTTYGATWRYV